ncbi:MAG: integrin alpha [Planctomycetota bacterium]|nr:integrin alpha [Planctomycetota bacterium]
MRTLTLSFLSVGLLATLSSAQGLLRDYNGSTGARLGAAFADGRDFNGDGIPEVIVGAPGGSGAGQVFAFNGQSIATGASPNYLSLITQGANGDDFGVCLAALQTSPNHTFAAGAPGADYNGGTANGFVRILFQSGNFLTPGNFVVGNSGDRLGTAVAKADDSNGDGQVDILAGAPYYDTAVANTGTVFLFNAGHINGAPGSLLIGQFSGIQADEHFGAALAVGHVNSGSRRDFVIASPDADFTLGGPPNVDVGWVRAYDGNTGAQIWWQVGSAAGDHFGAAVDAGKDVNGDGYGDIIVGAPGADGTTFGNIGRATVYSGRAISTGFGSLELYSWTGSLPGESFGACVRLVDDMSGDNVADIVVGAPGYEPLFSGANRGAVSIFSGATGLLLARYVGDVNENLGDAIGPTIADYNGDGELDLFVGGSSSDEIAANGGVFKVLSLYPAAPVAYCTAKVNSLGCSATMAGAGFPSVSSNAAFTISATNAINQTAGILFYGYSPSAAPFQGGTLCAHAPLIRTPIQNAGGSPSPAHNCTGVFSFDFNAWIDSGRDPSLVAGREVFAQYWYRDSASASTTALSNGLRFVVQP